MDNDRSCRTRNNLADGVGGPVRSSLALTLALTLVSSLVTLLVAPAAHGATHPRPAAGSVSPRAAHLLTPAPVRQDEEPIAVVGHGGFFDQTGRQIVPTAEFVARAQSWYRERLLTGLNARQRADFAAFEQRLTKGLSPGGQSGFVVQQRALDWLVEHSPRIAAEKRMRMKLNALKYRLQFQLPLRDDSKELRTLVPFKLDPMVEARLKLPEFRTARPAITKQATVNSGQDYIDECVANGVPIPPSIGVLDSNGVNGWKSLGFIPQISQFIEGTPAEFRVFENASGMCVALPRYTGPSKATVMLDGVICLSKTTSKVCFWDNQMDGDGFYFSTGSQIPIGVPNPAVDPSGRYQAGGAELEYGSGGVCTDCHAGENPYIIHPDVDLGGGLLMGSLGLPTFAPKRYDPLVGATWPQNKLSQSPALVPGACITCHTQSGAGRFPHLSKEYNVKDRPGYCKVILSQAIQKTMPQGNPGSEAGTQEIKDLLDWCDEAPSAGPSDRGDPHLTTTNGVHYDFQAAGEFTALRNSDTGFELQTRQTPVLTSFTPGANPYTGLQSCVSLNTAAALRVGRHRISYQPNPTEGSRGELQLRIDGKLINLPAGGLDLGDGNSIAKAAAGGGIDVRAEDGTRVIITPNYWSSQGYWYLNIEVLDTPAREGTMGHIRGGDFLPLAPDGSSFGPKPAAISARHTLLNATFANAWRVKSTTSLFDYVSGTSTASFTNTNWPPPPGSACTTITGGFPWPGVRYREPVRPLDPETARRLCSSIQDPVAFEECYFDVTVMGNGAMAYDYLLTLQLRSSP